MYLPAQRLERVHIWASDVKPPIGSGWNFGHIGYGYECAYNEGTPTSGMPTEFECDEGAIGQYIYLWFETTQYSTVCEVEVYGDGKDMRPNTNEFTNEIFFK